LGPDILRPYDAYVDLGRQTLRLAGEEVSLWSPEAGLRPSSLVVASDQLIHVQCEGEENSPVEPSPVINLPEGLYTVQTMIRNRREVPVRVLNATHPNESSQKSPLAHCEPVPLVTVCHMEQPHFRDTAPKLQDVNEASRTNLSDVKSRELEELRTTYCGIFALKNDDYGRTNRLYQHIDT
jgi:hypothetical protein